MTPFGKKIRQLRKARNINQKQMAADLSISPAYLSALEHGHRGKPSWAMVQKVIHYFELIWDEAEEIENLARLSHPRIIVDTSGLSPETTVFVNELAQKIQSLPLKKIKELSEILARKDNK
ncbi:MAG: helix-turn-helix domain-containing protein [Emcibacter sp.]|nr:helix-turn-helix domain-containing protein [Emcibacter sp.]